MEYYKDNHIVVYNKDCRNMSELEDNSIQCVVTSPPYWGLRKYAGEQDLIWGGDKNCEHKFNMPTPPRRSRTENDCPNPNTISAKSKGSCYNAEGGNTCSLCGGWRGAYGLEPTPDCGRPFAKLKENLTDKEIEYVMGELKRCGLL